MDAVTIIAVVSLAAGEPANVYTRSADNLATCDKLKAMVLDRYPGSDVFCLNRAVAPSYGFNPCAPASLTRRSELGICQLWSKP